MSILTMLFFLMIGWFLYHFIAVYNSKQLNLKNTLRKMGYGKSIGLFALITGIFGQLIGFYEAFSVIEHAGDISPAMVYGGIKISMITTLYGISIYLVSIMLWFAASIVIENKLGKELA